MGPPQKGLFFVEIPKPLFLIGGTPPKGSPQEPSLKKGVQEFAPRRSKGKKKLIKGSKAKGPKWAPLKAPLEP